MTDTKESPSPSTVCSNKTAGGDWLRLLLCQCPPVCICLLNKLLIPSVAELPYITSEQTAGVIQDVLLSETPPGAL